MKLSHRVTNKQDIGRLVNILAIVAIFAVISINPEAVMPVWMTVPFIFTTTMFYISALIFSIVPLRIPILELNIENIPFLKHMAGVFGGMIASCSTCTAFFIFCFSWEFMVLSIMTSPTAYRRFRSCIASYSRLLFFDVVLKINNRYLTNPAVILIYMNNRIFVYVSILVAFFTWYPQSEPPLEWREQFKLFLAVFYEIKFIIEDDI